VTVPLELLKPARKNPRRGAVAEVIESLREFGQHRPMVVQHSNGEVAVGNHMLKAMLQLGWTEGDILLVDDGDEKAMRRAIADNAVGDKAGWDEEELAEVMQEVGAVPGMTEADIDKLMAKIAPPPKVDEPTYPLVPRLNEKYDYVVVFCENETDWNWLQTRFDLRKERSYKSEAVATSHVITVARLQELLDG
jgi:ParB-like chromosome segregation protein Spo0J